MGSWWKFGNGLVAPSLLQCLELTDEGRKGRIGFLIELLIGHPRMSPQEGALVYYVRQTPGESQADSW